LRDCFGSSCIPRRRDEFLSIFLKQNASNDNHVVWFWMVAVAWALWITRNERIFQHKVLFNPIQPLYRALSLMLQWKLLFKSKRRAPTEEMIGLVDRKLRELRSVKSGVG
jgi:hypothetical protein